MERIGSFEAFDEGGERHTVHKYRGSTGPDAAAELRLPSGEQVHRHSKGLYSIAATGVRLTSSHRDAV